MAKVNVLAVKTMYQKVSDSVARSTRKATRLHYRQQTLGR